MLYSDHSLSIWDLTDLSRIALQRCFQGHGACIWDVASLPQNVPAGNGEQPPGVATCSADGSIRLWNVEERKGDVRNQKTGLVPGCQVRGEEISTELHSFKAAARVTAEIGHMGSEIWTQESESRRPECPVFVETGFCPFPKQYHRFTYRRMQFSLRKEHKC